MFGVNAQLFEGGIDFGLAASQIDGDDFGGYHHSGLSFSAYSLLNVTKTLSLTSGVGYIGKGAHSGLKSTYFATNLHYAEVPLLLNIKPYDKLSFSVGFTLGYLFRGIHKTTFGNFREDDLSLRKTDFSSYLSVNYALSERMTVKFVSNYNMLPITKPYSSGCWATNVLFTYFFRNLPANPCWWNNSLKVTFQYKIFWSGK